MNPTWSWVITQCSTALELTGCFISLLRDCLIWLGTYPHPLSCTSKRVLFVDTVYDWVWRRTKKSPTCLPLQLWSRTSSPHLFWHCPVVKNGNSKWRASSVLKFKSEPDQFQRNAAFGVSEPGVNNCPRTFVHMFHFIRATLIDKRRWYCQARAEQVQVHWYVDADNRGSHSKFRSWSRQTNTSYYMLSGS